MKRVNPRWWTSFAIFAVLGLAWVIATPIFAAPDEPAHVVRAAAAGHGQLLGRTPDVPVPAIFGSTLQVSAPGIYNGAGNITCMAWQSNVTAACIYLRGTRANIQEDTYVGHHPPAYYATVGFFSRVLRAGAAQVLLMRAIGMLVIAALLASALESLRRVASPMWAGAGMAVAVSPMVLFLSGTVSPSGVEIGAALGVWVHGAVLATEAPDTLDPRVINRLGVAAFVLVISRALSPVWLGVIGLVLLILCSRAGLLAIVKSHRTWFWGGVLAVGLAFQGWWFVYGQPLAKLVGTPVHASASTLVQTSFGKSGEMLREMVGVFGWLDTRAPGYTFFVWVLALGGLAALALGIAKARFVWSLLAATAATVVLPVIVESVGASKAGFIWQGRYTLPLAVGIPIIAGIAIGASEKAKFLGRRFGVILVVALSLAQALAFAQALRRYAVGAAGPIWFFPHEQWAPPIPSLLLIIGFGITVSVGLWWIVLAPTELFHRKRAQPPEPPVTVPAPSTPVVGEAPVTV